MFRKLLGVLSLLFLLPTGTLHAQMLNHQQGSLLVHLPKGSNPQNLAEKYARFEGSATHLHLQKELSSDLNIYLYSFDYQVINEIRFLQSIRKDESVIEAQFDHFVQARNTWPNDPYAVEQWQWLNPGNGPALADADIDADQAWDICTGGETPFGSKIVVAVLDDGMDLDHEDLAANLWTNEAEIPGNGIDDDQNGYTDDYRGWNVTAQNDLTYGGPHGTQVCGLIGAEGNNEKGISGLNWDVKMMLITGNWMLESEIIQGYSYALEMRRRYNASEGSEGAFVVATNLSWGLDGVPASEAPLWCAVYDSLGSAGILNVGATANQNWDVDVVGDLPTSCTSDYLLAVTSSTNEDLLAGSAAYGYLSIDLAAPGSYVFTTAYGDDYGYASGTSFAAPQATALAALLYAAPCPYLTELSQENPAAAVQLVKESILQGVDAKPAFEGKVSSGGRLNAYKSLMWLLNACSNCVAPNAPQLQTGNAGDELVLSWNGGMAGDIYYRISGESAWQILPQQESPATLYGLAPCTPYEFKIGISCSSGQTLFSPVTGMATAGCCDNPELIQLDLSQEPVIISWEPINGISDYLFEYRPQSENNWTSITTSETQLSLAGLSPCLTYEYRITSLCDNAGTSSPGSTQLFTLGGCEGCTDQTYCTPALDNSVEWIDAVVINGQTLQSGPNENAYALLAESTPYIDISREFELGVLPLSAFGSFEELLSVWIDLNQDGDFDDAGERLWAPEESYTTGSWVYTTLSLPENLPEDYYRMRIVLQYQENAGSFDFDNCPVANSPLEYFFGEAEDFCVYLTRHFCPVADNINIQTTSENTAEVHWESPLPGSSYIVQVRPEGGQSHMEFYAGNDMQFTLHNLSPCQSYELSIATQCDNDTVQSAWLPFQLPAPCEEFSEITATPNPFAGEMELMLPPHTQGRLMLQWYSSRGRFIYEEKINMEEGINRLSPNVSRLPAGLLFLKIQLPSGKEQILKVIKL